MAQGFQVSADEVHEHEIAIISQEKRVLTRELAVSRALTGELERRLGEAEKALAEYSSASSREEKADVPGE